MNEDLIPRSSVIEALKSIKEKGNIYCSVKPEKDEKTPHAFVILRKALDAVDAIPAVEAEAFATDTNDKWVSVDERLPEKQHDWVLAACKLVPEGYYGVPHIAELRNGKWWSDDGRFPLIEIGVKVTHWMPLPSVPEPPKGVQ